MCKMTTPESTSESRRVSPSEESRRFTPSSDYDLLIYLVTHPSITEEEARRELGLPLLEGRTPDVPYKATNSELIPCRRDQRDTSFASRL